MRALKIAGVLVLNAVLLVSASCAVDAPPATAVKISATVVDGGDAGHKTVDFSCAVESQGALIGTFSTMQSSLVVSRPLQNIRMTCNKAGFEQVAFAQTGPVTADVAPRFMVARKS